MAGIVVTAATGVMSSLLSKLSLLLSDQYKNLKGVQRDITFLSDELTEMNSALEKLASMDKIDCQKKVWRDKVREMAYDIEDCIDIFMHQLGEGDDKDGLVREMINKIRMLRVHHRIASKLQELKIRVVEQSECRQRYKIDESVSEPIVVEVDPRLPAMYEDAKRLVGIDGPRKKIIKQLMEEDDSESGQLKVLSIVGFGGLGKTTLANQVYAKIKNEFECSAFVSVSRTPHMPKILKDILSGVGYGGTEMEDDVKKLIDILRARLTNERYFVIIDDLWSIKDWDIIKCAFVENNKASRVITTTRIQDVAIASCKQGHVFQMQPLNELHSRKLFFKRLFDSEDSCPQQFRKISDQMLNKCKGIPLAITSITSLLAKHMHIDIWEKIHNSLGSELDTNPTLDWMRHVLSLSYNDLSHELKTCLLYLGMYPEDYKIPKVDLVRKWMAEGFVREKHGLDLEEAAENCYNELINRSMIQPCFNNVGFGDTLACQVHDLMLDLIILKCKEENFITIIDNKYPMNGASQVRRISHQFQDIDMPLTVDSVTGSTVRSYTSFPSFRLADCMHQLSKFELLRVLDVKFKNPVPIDLSAINHLFLLRYVRVHGYRVKLPKKFGKLNHLMTLDMLDPWYSGRHQSDFSSLTSLRHLSLPGKVTFKNGLSKLCNLRDLSSFHICVNSIECIKNLGELTNLRDLHVDAWDGAEYNSKMTILAASLNKLGNSSNLRRLSIVGPISAVTSPQFWSNCLTRPRHLQSLRHVVLNVKELRSDEVQLLAQLPCLTFLELRANTVPENNFIFHRNTFHSLKMFRFYCQFDLPLLTFEPAAMPWLQRLLVEGALFILKSGQITITLPQGGMQLQEGSLQGGSPVGGVEHLASLEEISLDIQTKCGQWSKIESAFRDAVSRHPKSHAIKISVTGSEYDENGKYVRDIRNTAAGTSGED